MSENTGDGGSQAANAAKQPMTIDPAQLDRIARAREADSTKVAQELGLNGIEPAIEKQRQKLEGAEEAKRSAWLQKGISSQNDQPNTQPAATSGNKVESDEIFTASESSVKTTVPPEIEQKFLRVGDKFYHPKNTDVVAFEDKGNKLETKSNSEAIAESMVRIAEARGWDEIKVSGSETFRKEVWLEAASRGMHVKGYSPSEQDKAELAKRTSQTEANKMEKVPTQFRGRENEQGTEEKPLQRNSELAKTFANEPPSEAVKKHPELAGSVGMAAMLNKQAEQASQPDGTPLTQEQRAIVEARVKQRIVNSIERGDMPEVKVREERSVQLPRNEEREVSR